MTTPTPDLSDIRAGLKLARGAALRFWLFSILGGTVAIPAVAAARNDCGGPEWGGCLGPFLMIFALVTSTLFGVVAALSHGVAVLFLRHAFAGMNHFHRVTSSALTVLAVLVVGYVLLPLGTTEPMESEELGRSLLLAGFLPLLLSLVIVPTVRRLPSARVDDGAPDLSDIRAGLKLARGAALRFWLFSILGGTVAILAFGECSGSECLDFLAIFFALERATVLGVVAALSHGVGVFFVRHSFAVLNPWHRIASSALTVLAVLVVGYLLPVSRSDKGGWILLLAGLLPLLLSLAVIPALSHLRGARGDSGAG